MNKTHKQVPSVCKQMKNSQTTYFNNNRYLTIKLITSTN